MSIDSEFIKARFREEAAQASSKHKDLQNLKAYMAYLQARFYGFLKGIEADSGKTRLHIESPQDIHPINEKIDQCIPQLLADRPELREIEGIIQGIRTKVVESVIERIYKDRQSYAEPLTNQRLAVERDLAKEVFPLITRMKAADKEEMITPYWIQINHPEAYERISKLISDPITQVLDWGKVRKLLPEDLQSRCDLVRKIEDPDRELLNQIRRHRKIAETLGPEALADYLVSECPQIARNFEHSLKIISRYLGRTTRRDFGPSDFKDLPPLVLKKQDLQKVVFINFRNYVYRRLIAEGTATEKPEKILRQVEKEVREKLAEAGANLQDHEMFLGKLLAYFKQVLGITISPRLEPTIQGKDGQPITVPSLRQRIAMHEMEKGEKKLIAFFMGKGKTATAFLAKEHVGAKKMLFVCPSGEMTNTVAAQVKKHYKPESETTGGKKILCPTIGIVRSGMDQKEVDEVKRCEIIIIPYSMLISKEREDGFITDQLCRIAEDQKGGRNIDFVAVDEVQWAKNDKGRFTEEVRKLVTRIPGLKYVASLSGDPTPNCPNDILPQLRIKYPEQFKEQEPETADSKGDSKKESPRPPKNANKAEVEATGKMRSFRYWMKRHDPLLLRSMLLDYILKLDCPENWQQYLEKVEVPLSASQKAHYDLILNLDLSVKEKIQQLMLAILNPSLQCPTCPDDAMVDTCAEIIQKDFETYDTVVIGEDQWKQGVMRPFEQNPGAPTFAEKLLDRLERKYGKDKVELLIIDGDTPAEDRTAYLEKARHPAQGKKVVLLAMLSIICEGINLSSIHRAILLEPTLRLADMAQFTKRFAREDNTDVKVRMLTVPHTVYQGIEEHALHKYMLTQRLLEGGTLTDEDLAFLEGDDFKGATEFRDGKLVIGSAISNAALNTRQTLSAYFHHIQNIGELDFEHFIETNGEDFAEKFVENWEGTYGANNARFMAGLTEALKKEGLVRGNRFADVACGPMAFENTYGLADEDAQITNYDLNPYMLEAGVELLRKRRHDPNYQPTKKVCGMTNLEARDGAFDVVSCSNALHYLGQRGTKDILRHERAKALMELNRVLRDDGTLVITLPPNVCEDDQFEAFQKELVHFGFKVNPTYSGEGHSVDQKNETEFRNRVVVCQKIGPVLTDRVVLANLVFSRIENHGEGKSTSRRSLEVSQSHHTEFLINRTRVQYDVVNGEQEAQKDDVRYQKLILRARTVLIKIYEKNGNSLESLPKWAIDELDQEGIDIVRLSGMRGNSKWTFSLKNQKLKTGISHFVFEDA